MTRLHFILALGISALLFAWMTWFFDTPAERLLTNRTDPFGLSGKIVLEIEKPYKNPNWKFIPCNGTTPKCGRLE